MTFRNGFVIPPTKVTNIYVCSIQESKRESQSKEKIRRGQ